MSAFGFGLWIENWGQISPNFLAHLPTAAQRLRGLVYMGAGVRNAGALERYGALRTLSLDLDLRVEMDLGELRRLRRLHLGGSGVSKVHSALSHPSLRDVFLEHADEMQLATLGSGIRTLELRSFGARELRLPEMPNLQALSIGQMVEVDIVGIGRNFGIARIEIDRVGLVAGFDVIARLPRLSSLELDNVKIVDSPKAVDDLPLHYFRVQGHSPFTEAQLRAFDARGVSGNRMHLVRTVRKPSA